MNKTLNRLAALRQALVRSGTDAFIVPKSDEHLSEYIGDYANRLEWLTGFRGSAGVAVVGKTQAALFVDGRYTLQVRAECDPALWQFEPAGLDAIIGWITAQQRTEAKIAFDPWLHSTRWVNDLQARLKAIGCTAMAVCGNPIDPLWMERPPRPRGPLVPHPLPYAGESAEAKLKRVAAAVSEHGCDATVLSALDSIAWLFNIRGNDIPNIPVGLAYAMVEANGAATILVDPEKITSTLLNCLPASVKVVDIAGFDQALAGYAARPVAIDPDRTPYAISEMLTRGGAVAIELRDPVIGYKAIKNMTEIAGTRAAHLRDGVALTRFLHWLATRTEGSESELSAAARLTGFREQNHGFCGVSFCTIAAIGDHGALAHYQATPTTDRPLRAGTLFLVDSGGQYRDGTTDVTRTVAIGQPDAEMRDRFTRVLKGHIALARAVFPAGTSGGQLDILARAALWEAGLDYSHGTGHGVGSYLSVHEGPQRIHRRGGDEPLSAGMIVSNEPGYYRPGHYGIRIENLVLVEAREIIGAEQAMFGFETLTLAPIDTSLIDFDQLSNIERSWLDEYHAKVRATLTPFLDDDVADWLTAQTAPLAAPLEA